MNAQLNYMMARLRSAELRHAGEEARLATEAPARGRRLRESHRRESSPPRKRRSSRPGGKAGLVLKRTGVPQR